MKNAQDRVTKFERAISEHHGSVQRAPGYGYLKVTGRPGEKQRIKLWDETGTRTQEWVRYGKQKARLAGGKEVEIQKGEKRVFYGRDGSHVATSKVKRKLKQPVVVIEAGLDTPMLREVIRSKPFVEEKEKTVKRMLGGREKKKSTRRIPLE